MDFIDKLKAWHDTKRGLLTYAVVEAALAYLFATWAIDSGSLIDWFLALALLFGSVMNFARLIARILHRG